MHNPNSQNIRRHLRADFGCAWIQWRVMVIVNTVLLDSFRPSPFLETGDDERDFMTAVSFLRFLLYESTVFRMS